MKQINKYRWEKDLPYLNQLYCTYEEIVWGAVMGGELKLHNANCTTNEKGGKK